jgi:murein DD-endopeptidase MepM/ murein hydrolase activator NlpD
MGPFENLSGRLLLHLPVILSGLVVCFPVAFHFTAGLSASAAQRASNSPGLSITAASRAMLPGELVVLTIAASGPEANIHVRVFGRDALPFQVDTHRWQALVGIDLDVTSGPHQAVVESGPPERHRATYDLIVRSKRFPTRNLTVDESFVNPPPSVTDRIAQEARELEQLWRTSSPDRLWTGEFVRPVPEAANSAFGTRSVFNGQPRSPHGGADFLSSAGTAVKAPNAGRVAVARELYFTGNTIVIDHGLGLYSMLAHLSAVDVHEGEMVSAGAVVGRVGATGRVTGPHLHWAVRVAGARVDPLSVLAMLGGPRPGPTSRPK